MPGLHLPKGQKAPSSSEGRVYGWKGSVLLPFPLLYPAPQRPCVLLALPSVTGPSCFLPRSLRGGSAASQMWGKWPPCPLAMSPVPQPVLLSPFHPPSPWRQRREGWRLLVLHPCGYWPHWGEPCAMQQPGLPSWDEVLASPAPAPGFLAPAPRSALSPCAPAAPWAVGTGG